MLDNIVRNSNGTFVPIEGYELYKASFVSAIYRKEDEILKIYNFCLPSNYRITEDIFSVLRGINRDNFIKLRDYYYKKIMIAYNCEYIEHEDFNILEKEYEFVEYNLKELEKLILILTKEGILIDDVGYRNYLCNGDNLVLIDPDGYRFYSSNECLRDVNYRRFLEGIANLYIKTYYNICNEYNVGSEEFNNIINNIFSFNQGDKNPIDSACKRLREAKLTYYKKDDKFT